MQPEPHGEYLVTAVAISPDRGCHQARNGGAFKEFFADADPEETKTYFFVKPGARPKNERPYVVLVCLFMVPGSGGHTGPHPP